MKRSAIHLRESLQDHGHGLKESIQDPVMSSCDQMHAGLTVAENVRQLLLPFATASAHQGAGVMERSVVDWEDVQSCTENEIPVREPEKRAVLEKVVGMERLAGRGVNFALAGFTYQSLEQPVSEGTLHSSLWRRWRDCSLHSNDRSYVINGPGSFAGTLGSDGGRSGAGPECGVVIGAVAETTIRRSVKVGNHLPSVAGLGAFIDD